MAGFDVFSKRGKPMPDVYVIDQLPEKLRNQITHIWKNTGFLSGSHSQGDEAWERICDILYREHGILSLWKQNHRNHPPSDVYDFLRQHYQPSDLLLALDLIELSFRAILKVHADYLYIKRSDAIDELNHRFQENGIGYEFDAKTGNLIVITNQVIHQTAIRPALYLLSDPAYKHAQDEFLEALEDFKKAEHADCLTKCCTAMESVMKIIIQNKTGTHDPKATASSLVPDTIAALGLETFFDQPFMLIATIRNRLSRSHGQGPVAKKAEEHYARYALNATGSVIVFLVESA